MNELKTNYKDAAMRYLLAERQVWAKLPDWKKHTVVDCRKKDWEEVKYDRILSEYNTAVISLAESSTVLDDTLPAVPVTKQNLKVEAEPEPVSNPS
jgi:hypothetical protein